MKKFILVILSLAIAVFAKQISVDISKDIIQLGVFKDINNIKKLQKKFSEYNIYIKSFEGGLKKAYIVNISKDKIQKYIAHVRQSIPHAFLLSDETKLKVFKNLQLCNVDISQPKDENIKNNELIYKDTSCLDSKAIIKTRKKFFE